MTCVYILDDGNGLMKVGASRRPNQRASATRSLGKPDTKIVFKTGELPNAAAVERQAQALLACYRVGGSEWFSTDKQTAVDAVRMALTEPSQKRVFFRGRPPKSTGRLKVLQAGFEPDEAAEIEKIAAREEQPISAVVRELALEGLKARKRKGAKS